MMNHEHDNDQSFQDNTYHFNYTDPTSGGYRVYDAPKQHNRKGGVGRVIALGLCCALVGGCVGGGMGVYFAGNGSSGASTTAIYESSRETATVETLSVSGTQEMTVAEVYAANVGSTVGITADVTTNIFGMTTTGAVAGSGFIISSDGYIVTNHHVIEGASSITVTLEDGTQYTAAVVGSDEDNDLAVLKADVGDDVLTPVVLGSSDSVNVGDTVVAIGNPLGELTFSCTSGVISAVDRSITMSTGTIMNLMQTDCAINSGNSGGALFNTYGEVIGITNAKYSSSTSSSSASIDNIGFAIPIDQVKDLITQIIETGKVTKPYLGVRVVTVSETDAQRYNLSVGVYVNSVTEGSCAANAGLQAGDVITALDGESVTSTTELNARKNQHQPGDTITLTVDRNGQTLELTVTLDEEPDTTETTDSTTGSEGYSDGYSGNNSNDPWSYFYGNPYSTNPYGTN